MVTNEADMFCLYSYLMTSSKTLKTRERGIFRMYQGSLRTMGMRANPSAGEMVLPMMMTQGDQDRGQEAVELGELWKAL